MAENDRGTLAPSTADVPGIAPAFNTGGGGFVVGNKVCARAMVSILTSVGVPGIGARNLVEVSCQTRSLGWLLDDLLLAWTENGTFRRAAVSVKAGEQFGETSAPAEFVSLAWTQMLGLGTSTNAFQETNDYLCLACPLTDSELERQLHELLAEAAVQGPAQLAQYITAGAVAKLRRQLYESFACPASLAQGRDPAEMLPGRLLRRVRFWKIDFRNTGSISEAESLAACGEALNNPADAARPLWETLCEIAADLRPRSGHTTLADLLDRLRGRFSMRAHPSYERDIQRLYDDAQRQAEAGRNTLGPRIALDLSVLVGEVQAVLRPGRVVLMHGPSGCGKSHIARRLLKGALREKALAVWLPCAELNDRGLTHLLARLGLENALETIAPASPSSRRLVVLDAGDKLAAPSALEDAGRLLRSLVRSTEVLITTTSAEANRLSVALQQHGVPDGDIHVMAAPAVSPDLVLSYLQDYPELQRVADNPEARSLLSRLKIVDVFVSNIDRLRSTNANPIVGEASMIDWFWMYVIESAPNRTQRSGFLKKLAGRLADESRSSIAEDELTPDEAGLADEMIALGVLSRDGGQLGFDHDLYGDWARQQLLLSKGNNLRSFLAERRGLVAWHTAVRLLAAKRIESPSHQATWQSLFADLDAHVGPSVYADIVLEALSEVPASPDPLHAAADEILGNGGQLLRRLLGRVLTAGSVEGIIGTATGRVPLFRLWRRPTRFVMAHLSRCVEIAPVDVCRLLASWTVWANPAWRTTKDTARAVIELARRCRAERALTFDQRLLPHDMNRPLFEGCLASIAVDPGEAKKILLVLAERSQEPGLVDNDDEVVDDVVGVLVTQRRTSAGAIIRSPTCELGPQRRVDDEFRDVCANAFSMAPVMRVDPALAAELVVATVVEPPRALVGYRSEELENLFSSGSFRLFYPPMWFKGTFLQLLKSAPDDGLRAITILSQHLVACYVLQSQLEGKKPVTVEIEVAGKVTAWAGDQKLFLAYQDGPHVPDPAVAALMALEKYLYEIIDGGADAGAVLTKLLEEGNVPIAGVLSAVALYRPHLVRTSLSPLLSAAEFLAWDWERSVHRHDRMTASIAWGMKGKSATDVVSQWVSMPHRQRNLLDQAKGVFVADPASADLFARATARWKTTYTDESEWPSVFELNRLCAFFDHANWRQSPIDNGIAYQFVPPEAIATRDAAGMSASEENLFWLMAPSRSTEALARGQLLSNAQVDDFSMTLERARAASLDSGAPQGRSMIDAVAGAASALLTLTPPTHPFAPPLREDCRAKLIEICRRPPHPSQFDGESSAYSMGWDRSAARALPVLWAEDPSAEDIRRAICGVVFAHHYESLTLLAHGVFARRDAIGDDVLRFWIFTLKTAVLSEVSHQLRHDRKRGKSIASLLGRKARDFAEEFVRAAAPPTLPTITDLSAIIPLRDRKLRAPTADLGWIGALSVAIAPEGAIPPRRAADWCEWWSLVIELLSQRPESAIAERGTGLNARDDERQPMLKVYGDEESVMKPLARVIAATTRDADARLLWERMLLYGPRWTESFLDHWLSVPVGDVNAERFIQRWRAIIDGIRERMGGCRRIYAHALGIDQIGPRYWGPEGPRIIEGIRDLLIECVGACDDSGDLAHAAAFLRLDVCSSILGEAVPALFPSVKRVAARGRLRLEDGAQVARAAAIAWRRQGQAQTASAESLAALRELIDLLASHHVVQAIDFQREIHGAPS